MEKFSRKERKFLSENYIARIATCTLSGIPHVSPIYFASDGHSIFFATEESTVKVRDLSENKKASIVVDQFDADWLHGRNGTKTKERAVVISGTAIVYRKGRTYSKMYTKLVRKYPDYRNQRTWKSDESPIVRVHVSKLTTWGL